MGNAARRAALLAIAVFVALIAARLWSDALGTETPGSEHSGMAYGFELSRKNYAGFSKTGSDSRSQLPGDVQKYEKVATLSETTAAFEDTRRKVEDLISSVDGLIQYENLLGLTGRRVLHLGVGVPPVKFDGFIEALLKLARLTSLSIVKNDKTNEYRELRARRETLEKARQALVDLGASGGSVDERLKVQSRLTELEGKIQELGVSLGDFDSENQFCTVKLTLEERPAPGGTSWPGRLFAALTWSIPYFAMLAGGFLMLCLALWLGALTLGVALRTSRHLTRDES